MSWIGEQCLFQVAGRDRFPHCQRKKIDRFFGCRAEQVSARGAPCMTGVGDVIAGFFKRWLPRWKRSVAAILDAVFGFR